MTPKDILVPLGLLFSSFFLLITIYPLIPTYTLIPLLLLLLSYTGTKYVLRVSVSKLHKPLSILCYTSFAFVAIATPYFALGWILYLLDLIGYARMVYTALGLTIVTMVIGRVHAKNIKKVHHSIEGKPLKICHISDLHLGVFYKKKFVERIVATIKETKPDVICITGDVFDGSGNPTEEWLESFKELDNVYTVLGNHDGYFGEEKAQRLLESAGVNVLRNEKTMCKGYEIHGYDDKSILGGLPNLFKKPEIPSITLYHRPGPKEFIKRIDTDIVLCGHTHGGQILPAGLVILLENCFLSGFKNIDGKKLNISQGTGTGGPPIRFGTSSEITIITVS